MESDDESHSSNSSESSNSSSNGPASPSENKELERIPANESVADLEKQNEIHNDSENVSNQDMSKEDEEELELSDLDDNEGEFKNPKQTADISHEDLSDISDLESSNDAASQGYDDLRQKINKVNHPFMMMSSYLISIYV